MTNAERRAALNKARERAMKYALEMELTDTPPHFRAAVWAHVANAMKDGDPIHDAPDGQPSSPVLNTEYGVITR